MSVAAATHLAPVETREELLYLLTRASELEHDLACSYLYAGYSIKMRPDEGGITHDELLAIRGWKQRIAHVAVEEMLHLAQVSNILTAVGGAPHFFRSNFPLNATAFPFGIEITLEPLSRELIERFMCYEMPADEVIPAHLRPLCGDIRLRTTAHIDHDDIVRQQNAIEPFDVDFRTIGEFYKKIETAFDTIKPDRLFIGDPDDQARPTYLDLQRQLIRVHDAASAHRAVERIIDQGEAPPRHHPDAHFYVFHSIHEEYEQLTQRAKADGRVFEPFRKMLTNPVTRVVGPSDGLNRITDASSRELAEIFNSVYELMLMMLARFFAHGGETEEQLRLLSRGTLRMMASGLRPLGEALSRMPAGPNYPGLTAGPPFGITQNVRLLSHRKVAWIFFLERLYDLSTRLTNLAKEATLPQEVQEAAAALESVAEHLTPFIPPEFAQAVRETARAVATARRSAPSSTVPTSCATCASSATPKARASTCVRSSRSAAAAARTSNPIATARTHGSISVASSSRIARPTIWTHTKPKRSPCSTIVARARTSATAPIICPRSFTSMANRS
jgi:hypothetical protein